MMGRKILTLCIAVLLLMSCVMAVSAEEFDSKRTGSISVTLTEQYEKMPIVGAELSVYYIATVGINTDGKLNYIYTETFSESGIAIDDPDLAVKLDAYLAQNQVTATKQRTDAAGTVCYEALPLGLYFIRQTNTVEGFAPCTPFLVTIPAENTGVYEYSVNASPKTEVARLTTVTIKKVWNTDASAEAADRVTVQLLRNDNVVKTAILNVQNNWQETYIDMPESDAYSIREIDIPKGFTATYSEKDYVFTVTNTATLAQTGQLIWPIPLLAVSGMLLIAVGITLLRKKRTTHA